MGFWNVKARDLKYADEIRVGGVGQEEFLIVRDVDTGGASGRVAVRTTQTFHLDAESVWVDFDPDERLTVRR